MANRRGKVCRFTPYPYPKDKKESDLEKEKTRLDIEVLESLKARYKDVTPLRDSFSHIIKILKDYNKK